MHLRKSFCILAFVLELLVRRRASDGISTTFLIKYSPGLHLSSSCLGIPRAVNAKLASSITRRTSFRRLREKEPASDKSTTTLSMAQFEFASSFNKTVSTLSTASTSIQQRPPRPVCSRCKRASAVCICKCLPDKPFSLQGRLRVIILQHRHEQSKGIASSVTILPFCIDDFHLIRGDSFDIASHPLISEAFHDPDNRPILIYPREEAINIEDYHSLYRSQSQETMFDELNPEDESLPRKKLTLIFADGTWYEARKIMHRSPEIVRESVNVKFSKPVDSIIGPIRREPEKNFMSTLEAVAYSLVTLDSSDEVKEAADFMVNALREVVSMQLAYKNSTMRSVRYQEKAAKRRLEKLIIDTHSATEALAGAD